MKFSFLLSEKIIFPVCIIVLMIWHFYSLLEYPMYFPDDAMVGSRIKSMIEVGNSMGTMELAAYNEVADLEKIFSKTAYLLSTLPARISGEITLHTVRVMNLLYIFILLCLVFYLSKEIKDWRLGILSIFILGFSLRRIFQGG